MTNDPLNDHLRELSWRRALTPAEQARLRAWLAAHPEAQADWEAEAGLTEALDRMPNVPVSSNFTAQVMNAIGREVAGRKQNRLRLWSSHFWQARWLPKAAVAALVLGGGLFLNQAIQKDAQRREIAKSLVAVSDAAAVPDPKILPEILEDYQAIQASSQAALADDQLLALFK